MTAAACPLCGGSRWDPLHVTRTDGMETAARFWPGKTAFDHLLCRGCGLVRQHPLPAPSQLDRFYADFRFFRETEGGFLAQNAARIVAFVKQHGRTAVRALDVGCGGGELLRALQREGAEVLGLELSPAAGAQAEQGDVPVVYGGVAEPPPGAPFDLVCSITVLEHLLDPLRTLGRMAEWTRPGQGLRHR